MTLDDPDRIEDLRRTIERKATLRLWYLETYQKYRECLARAPARGIALELGSGGGFAKSLIPELTTSDVLPYKGVDLVVDATRMPFADESLRAIFMFNVLHHVSDAEALFQEAQRCLMSDGRLLIIDQYRGWLSAPILKYLHHEPFDEQSRAWAFPSEGPLTGANGALPWIIFHRDRARFERLFPRLRIARCQTHSPLRYWLSGGLRRWSLLPRGAFGLATRLDDLLVRLSPELGSFFDIELVKTLPDTPRETC